MTLGEQIRAAREGKNLSQEALAEYLGVSRQAVSKWENDTAVPQGANMNMLAELLGLETAQEETPPKKHNIAAWVGWALVIVLLLALVGTLIYPEAALPDGSAVGATETPSDAVSSPEEKVEEPTLHSIRFYDKAQEEVFSENAMFSEYNTAKIDSILIQWTGDTPLRTVKMFFSSTGRDAMQTELLEVSVPADAGNALLLSADSLHQNDLMGHLYFELHFDGGYTITTYDPYHMDLVFFDDSFTVHAYIESFDGEQLTFDEVEWINIPSARAQALGITDPGSGFYIYNEQAVTAQSHVAENCVFEVLIWDEDGSPVLTTLSASEFRTFLEESTYVRLYWLTFEDDQVTQIRERYVP